MPGRKASGSLTAEQLGAVAEASLANAADLIGESRGLIEGGAVARSYSLAVLAAEEFGKCQLAIGSIGREAENADYWKEWWSVFYGHGPKLARAAALAAFVLPAKLVETFVSVLEPALKEQRRERGFYVDFIGDSLIWPADTIDTQEAVDAINSFGAVIDAYADSFRDGGLAEAFSEANAGPAQVMRTAVASGDRERIRATWEATTGRRPEDAEMDQIMAILDDDT